MSRAIGSPVSVTVQKRREVVKIIIDIGGTDLVPTYELAAFAAYVSRDGAGVEVGRDANQAVLRIGDAQITGNPRTSIANMVAKLDTLTLQNEP